MSAIWTAFKLLGETESEFDVRVYEEEDTCTYHMRRSAIWTAFKLLGETK
jgi:hypothetical protein